MPEQRLQCKKSAIGATDITLVPSTQNLDAMTPETPITQVVVTTGAISPPTEFWGTGTADGAEFEILIRRKG